MALYKTNSQGRVRMTDEEEAQFLEFAEWQIDTQKERQYIDDRQKAYPLITDQLDQIYHEGIDAWKETIKAVKDANPKP